MSRTIHSLAVYCGSSNDVADVYKAAARDLGHALATRGIRIVYGGGSVGLMGELAESAMASGGEVVGVITDRLMELEVARKDLSELRIVRTMHDRKLAMADLSDAFVALPGGYGTLDELFEAVTWSQLNVHHKPTALFDVDGYFEHLVAFLDHAERQGFVRKPHRALVQHHHDVDSLLAGLSTAVIPAFGRWVVEP